MTASEPGRTHALAFIERELERAQRKVIFWQARCAMLEEHLRQWNATHGAHIERGDHLGEGNG